MLINIIIIIMVSSFERMRALPASIYHSQMFSSASTHHLSAATILNVRIVYGTKYTQASSVCTLIISQLKILHKRLEGI